MTAEAQPAPRRRKTAWKRVEQEGGRWLHLHDGPDPAVRGQGWVSSIGRVARTTQAGFDLLSLHYCGEAKSRESFPRWLMDCWLQIVDVAKHHGKAALLILKEPRIPPMHIITAERHAELLGYEREVEQRLREGA